MSINLLPEETLELVVSFLHVPANSYTCKDLLKTHADPVALADDYVDGVDYSLGDLSSMALVSKTFLPHARKHLYRKLPTDPASPWRTALLLHRTLAATSLASNVRDLGALPNWMIALDDGPVSEFPPLFTSSSFRPSVAWLISIIKLCPNLQAVGVPVESSECLSSLLQALKPSSGTLTTIEFHASEAGETDWPTRVHFVNSILADLGHINSIAVEDDDSSETDISILPPSIRARPQRLKIFSSWSSTDESKRFLVQDPSFLRTLEMALDFDYRHTQDVEWIYNYVPPQLEQLLLSGSKTGELQAVTLEEYLVPPVWPPLLPNHFPSLPFLRRLDLVGFHGPSLQLLTKLVTATPSLVYLSFSESWWKPDSPLDPATVPSVFVDLAFPEQDVLSALLSFSHLRFVDLGYLPTVNREDYRGLEESLKENGIEAEWTECEE